MNSRLTVPSEQCKICDKQCDAAALKCTQCKCFIHIHCAGLPFYYLVNYFNSRIHYACEVCVKNTFAMEYEDQSDLLREQINRTTSTTSTQEVLVEAAAGTSPSAPPLSQETVAAEDDEDLDSSCQSDVTEDDDFNDSTVGVRTGTNAGKKTQAPPERVCRYYKRKACRHGLNGKTGQGCKFAHPKMCFKFIKNASHKVGGCTKGKKCQFYHPPLCSTSVARRECSNEKCKYMHLKGTVTPVTEQHQKQAPESRTYARTVKNTGYNPPPTQRKGHFRQQQREGLQPHEPWHSQPSLGSETRSSGTASNTNDARDKDFLELQKQVLNIQQQIQVLITAQGQSTSQNLIQCKCAMTGMRHLP